jgi:RNA polymerase sigma-70 factor (sigma-E family)
LAEWDTAFAEYYQGRAERMRGTAYLLCGDWSRAEDLVQSAFTKLYIAWPRVEKRESLDGYLRRIVVRGYLDQRRRGWWHREQSSEFLPEQPLPVVDAEDRLVLLAALQQLPPRQRAVIVMRYWADLSIEETAETLKCAPGTVKSQAARGLQTLRDLLPGFVPVYSTQERKA